MSASAGAIRAGRAFVELFAEDSQLVRGLKTAERYVAAFGTKIFAIGARINAAGAALLAPLIFAAQRFMKVGDDLDKMSQRTGFGVEQLSSLAYAAETAGVEAEGFENSLRGMQKTIAAAATGSKEANAQLGALGLSIAQLQVLRPDQQFRLLADRIAMIPDPAMRTAAALNVFGKQGAALLPLLLKGAAGIEALQAEAEKLGVTMTSDQARAAAELADAWGRIKAQLTTVSVQIGAALAPLLTELATSATRYLRIAIDWIRTHRGLITTIFAIVAGGTAFGATLAAVGLGLRVATLATTPLIQAVSLLGRGFGVGLIGAGKILRFVTVEARVLGRYLAMLLGPIVKAGLAFFTRGFSAAAAILKGGLMAILSPIGLLGAALVGLGAVFVAQSGVIGSVLGNLRKAFGDIKQDALIAFQGIADALAAGDLGLAAEIGLSFVKIAWTRLTNGLRQSWLEFKKFFLDTWANASTAAADLMLRAVNAIQRAWLSTKSFISQTLRDAKNGWSLLFLEMQGALGILSEADVIESQRQIVEQGKADEAKADAALAAGKNQLNADLKSNLENNRAIHDAAEQAREKEFNDKIAKQTEELNGLLERRKNLVEEAARKRKEVEAGRGRSTGEDTSFDIDGVAAKARHAAQLSELADFERGTNKGLGLVLSSLGIKQNDDDQKKLLGSIKTNTGLAATALRDAAIVREVQT